MADVLKPEAFNERFTVYLDAEGKPVERTLREMTAGEVLKALEWLGEEIARLERGEALKCFGEAEQTLARLMHRVIAILPPQATEHLALRDALLRYWPGGRAP